MNKPTTYWPYGIIVAFLIFCSFMIGFAVYSTNNKTELLADDYYDQGIRYQEVIDGMARMKQLNQGELLSMVSDSITIALPNALISADSGSLRFYKPDSEALDFSKELVALEGGKWQLAKAEFSPGPWQVVVEVYREGELYYHEQRMVIE
jgi:hypothetical protein